MIQQWKRSTVVSKRKGEVQWIRIYENKDSEVTVVKAEPTGPDGVFVIQTEPIATQYDVDQMIEALSAEKIPFINQKF